MHTHPSHRGSISVKSISTNIFHYLQSRKLFSVDCCKLRYTVSDATVSIQTWYHPCHHYLQFRKLLSVDCCKLRCTVSDATVSIQTWHHPRQPASLSSIISTQGFIHAYKWKQNNKTACKTGWLAISKAARRIQHSICEVGSQCCIVALLRTSNLGLGSFCKCSKSYRVNMSTKTILPVFPHSLD